MSRRRISSAVLLVTVMCAVAWFASEPSYQGRSLHAWLEDLDDQHPGPKNDAAVDAVRHIGHNAVPEIISLLESRDSSLQQRFLKWLSDHHVVKSPYSPVLENQYRAVLACNVIGPEAKPAICGQFSEDSIPLTIRPTNEPHLHQWQIATKCGNGFVAMTPFDMRICRLLLPSREGFSRGQALLLSPPKLSASAKWSRFGRGMSAP